MASTSIVHSPPQGRLLSIPHVQVRLFLAAVFCMDAFMLGVAFLLAGFIRFRSGITLFEDSTASGSIHVLIAIVLLPVWLLVFYGSQLYNTHYLFGSTQEYKRVFSASTEVFTLVIVGTFLFPIVRVSRGWIVLAVVGAIIFVIIGRFLLRKIAHLLRANGFLNSRTLIIGMDDEAIAIAQQLLSIPDCGVSIVGFVDQVAREPTTGVEGLRVQGTLEALPELVNKLQIDQLIVSPSALSRENVLWVFQTFGNSDELDLRFSPGLFQIYTSGVQVKEIGNVHLVSMRKTRLDAIESGFKSALDYSLSLFTLLCLLPLFFIVGIAIKWDSPGPVLHRRRVVGGRGREFDAFKFRTMYRNGDEILARHPELKAELATNHKLKDDPRVTRVGRILRRFSIDELPQLLNVLLGNMSLVGPRMITPPEVSKYGKWHLNLWTVKPGITGLWQVSGRSDVSYDERVRLDMYYIRNYTMWSDLRILLQTIPAVLSRKGAY